MPPRFFLTVLFFALTCGGAFATGERGSDAAAPMQIIEVSPMSITLDAGKDVQESYAITANTRATLDGLAVQAGDLRAGMTASLSLAPDAKTVLAITAHNAQREVKKTKKEHDNVNLNVGLHK